MVIAVISDTHLPSARRTLPAKCVERLVKADLILHAGDVSSTEALHEERDGFQIFNPGSPVERRRAPRHTMGLARADGRRVAFELIALD
jgi:predicted phosphodiesterase